MNAREILIINVSEIVEIDYTFRKIYAIIIMQLREKI